MFSSYFNKSFGGIRNLILMCYETIYNFCEKNYIRKFTIFTVREDL